MAVLHPTATEDSFLGQRPKGQKIMVIKVFYIVNLTRLQAKKEDIFWSS